MKSKIFLFFLLCLGSAAYSQSTTKFIYTYDASGNRIKREIEVTPLPPEQAPPVAQNETYKTDETNEASGINNNTAKFAAAVVYPNPTFGLLNINLESFENSTYQLFDITGKEIQRGVINSAQTILDISNEGSGQYVLRISSNGQIQSFSIIKKS